MLLLLDLSAAFDTVDHKILLGRLSSRFGIKGKALDWLRSYLTDRTQLVKVDDASSTVRPLHWGVPQGSVLGPMLYLLYTSPLGDIVREHGLPFHFYADDSQLYTSFAYNDTSDLVAAKQRLENCVADINLWMTANKLKLISLSALPFSSFVTPSHDFCWHGKHQALSTGSQSWRDF